MPTAAQAMASASAARTAAADGSSGTGAVYVSKAAGLSDASDSEASARDAAITQSVKAAGTSSAKHAACDEVTHAEAEGLAAGLHASTCTAQEGALPCADGMQLVQRSVALQDPGGPSSFKPEYCINLPFADKAQLSAALIADTLAAMPVPPQTVTNVQGPVLEVHPVNDHSVDVRIMHSFTANFDEPLQQVYERAVAAKVAAAQQQQQLGALALSLQQQQHQTAAGAPAVGDAATRENEYGAAQYHVQSPQQHQHHWRQHAYGHQHQHHRSHCNSSEADQCCQCTELREEDVHLLPSGIKHSACCVVHEHDQSTDTDDTASNTARASSMGGKSTCSAANSQPSSADSMFAAAAAAAGNAHYAASPFGAAAIHAEDSIAGADARRPAHRYRQHHRQQQGAGAASAVNPLHRLSVEVLEPTSEAGMSSSGVRTTAAGAEVVVSPSAIDVGDTSSEGSYAAGRSSRVKHRGQPHTSHGQQQWWEGAGSNGSEHSDASTHIGDATAGSSSRPGDMPDNAAVFPGPAVSCEMQHHTPVLVTMEQRQRTAHGHEEVQVAPLHGLQKHQQEDTGEEALHDQQQLALQAQHTNPMDLHILHQPTGFVPLSVTTAGPAAAAAGRHEQHEGTQQRQPSWATGGSPGNTMLMPRRHQHLHVASPGVVHPRAMPRMFVPRCEWELDPRKVLVGRRLAVGGFAEVFLGKYEGTVVAIKRLLTNDAVTIERFVSEVRMLARLRHPNLILFMGYCTMPELCIVSEYMNKGSLYGVLHSPEQRKQRAAAARKQLLDKQGHSEQHGTVASSVADASEPTGGCNAVALAAAGSMDPGLDMQLSPAQEQEKQLEGLEPKLQRLVAISVARGMAYLHTRIPPILHLDLKTPNILADDRWRIKITDFGLSRARQRTFVSSSAQGGTPEWMAPEVLRCEAVAEPADVYSYGVVLWELITGRAPWENYNPMQVVAMVGFRELSLPLPSTAAEPFLLELCKRCLQRNPSARPTFPQIAALLDQHYGPPAWAAHAQPLMPPTPRPALPGFAPCGPAAAHNNAILLPAPPNALVVKDAREQHQERPPGRQEEQLYAEQPVQEEQTPPVRSSAAAAAVVAASPFAGDLAPWSVESMPALHNAAEPGAAHAGAAATAGSARAAGVAAASPFAGNMAPWSVESVQNMHSTAAIAEAVPISAAPAAAELAAPAGVAAASPFAGNMAPWSVESVQKMHSAAVIAAAAPTSAAPAAAEPAAPVGVAAASPFAGNMAPWSVESVQDLKEQAAATVSASAVPAAAATGYASPFAGNVEPWSIDSLNSYGEAAHSAAPATAGSRHNVQSSSTDSSSSSGCMPFSSSTSRTVTPAALTVQQRDQIEQGSVGLSAAAEPAAAAAAKDSKPDQGATTAASIPAAIIAEPVAAEALMPFQVATAVAAAAAAAAFGSPSTHGAPSRPELVEFIAPAPGAMVAHDEAVTPVPVAPCAEELPLGEELAGVAAPCAESPTAPLQFRPGPECVTTPLKVGAVQPALAASVNNSVDGACLQQKGQLHQQCASMLSHVGNSEDLAARSAALALHTPAVSRSNSAALGNRVACGGGGGGGGAADVGMIPLPGGTLASKLESIGTATQHMSGGGDFEAAEMCARPVASAPGALDSSSSDACAMHRSRRGADGPASAPAGAVWSNAATAAAWHAIVAREQAGSTAGLSSQMPSEASFLHSLWPSMTTDGSLASFQVGRRITDTNRDSSGSGGSSSDNGSTPVAESAVAAAAAALPEAFAGPLCCQLRDEQHSSHGPEADVTAAGDANAVSDGSCSSALDTVSGQQQASCQPLPVYHVWPVLLASSMIGESGTASASSSDLPLLLRMASPGAGNSKSRSKGATACFTANGAFIAAAAAANGLAQPGSPVTVAAGALQSGRLRPDADDVCDSHWDAAVALSNKGGVSRTHSTGSQISSPSASSDARSPRPLLPPQKESQQQPGQVAQQLPTQLQKLSKQQQDLYQHIQQQQVELQTKQDHPQDHTHGRLLAVPKRLLHGHLSSRSHSVDASVLRQAAQQPHHREQQQISSLLKKGRFTVVSTVPSASKPDSSLSDEPADAIAAGDDVKGPGLKSRSPPPSPTAKAAAAAAKQASLAAIKPSKQLCRAHAGTSRTSAVAAANTAADDTSSCGNQLTEQCTAPLQRQQLSLGLGSLAGSVTGPVWVGPAPAAATMSAAAAAAAAATSGANGSLGLMSAFACPSTAVVSALYSDAAYAAAPTTPAADTHVYPAAQSSPQLGSVAQQPLQQQTQLLPMMYSAPVMPSMTLPSGLGQNADSDVSICVWGSGVNLPIGLQAPAAGNSQALQSSCSVQQPQQAWRPRGASSPGTGLIHSASATARIEGRVSDADGLASSGSQGGLSCNPSMGQLLQMHFSTGGLAGGGVCYKSGRFSVTVEQQQQLQLQRGNGRSLKACNSTGTMLAAVMEGAAMSAEAAAGAEHTQQQAASPLHVSVSCGGLLGLQQEAAGTADDASVTNAALQSSECGSYWSSEATSLSPSLAASKRASHAAEDVMLATTTAGTLLPLALDASFASAASLTGSEVDVVVPMGQLQLAKLQMPVQADGSVAAAQAAVAPSAEVSGEAACAASAALPGRGPYTGRPHAVHEQPQQPQSAAVALHQRRRLAHTPAELTVPPSAAGAAYASVVQCPAPVSLQQQQQQHGSAVLSAQVQQTSRCSASSIATQPQISRTVSTTSSSAASPRSAAGSGKPPLMPQCKSPSPGGTPLPSPRPKAVTRDYCRGRFQVHESPLVGPLQLKSSGGTNPPHSTPAVTPTAAAAIAAASGSQFASPGGAKMAANAVDSSMGAAGVFVAHLPPHDQRLAAVGTAPVSQAATAFNSAASSRRQSDDGRTQHLGCKLHATAVTPQSPEHQTKFSGSAAAYGSPSAAVAIAGHPAGRPSSAGSPIHAGRSSAHVSASTAAGACAIPLAAHGRQGSVDAKPAVSNDQAAVGTTTAAAGGGGEATGQLTKVLSSVKLGRFVVSTHESPGGGRLSRPGSMPGSAQASRQGSPRGEHPPLPSKLGSNKNLAAVALPGDRSVLSAAGSAAAAHTARRMLDASKLAQQQQQVAVGGAVAVGPESTATTAHATTIAGQPVAPEAMQPARSAALSDFSMSSSTSALVAGTTQAGAAPAMPAPVCTVSKRGRFVVTQVTPASTVCSTPKSGCTVAPAAACFNGSFTEATAPAVATSGVVNPARTGADEVLVAGDVDGRSDPNALGAAAAAAAAAWLEAAAASSAAAVGATAQVLGSTTSDAVVVTCPVCDTPHAVTGQHMPGTSVVSFARPVSASRLCVELEAGGSVSQQQVPAHAAAADGLVTANASVAKPVLAAANADRLIAALADQHQDVSAGRSRSPCPVHAARIASPTSTPRRSASPVLHTCSSCGAPLPPLQAAVAANSDLAVQQVSVLNAGTASEAVQVAMLPEVAVALQGAAAAGGNALGSVSASVGIGGPVGHAVVPQGLLAVAAARVLAARQQLQHEGSYCSDVSSQVSLVSFAQQQQQRQPAHSVQHAEASSAQQLQAEVNRVGDAAEGGTIAMNRSSSVSCLVADGSAAGIVDPAQAAAVALPHMSATGGPVTADAVVTAAEQVMQLAPSEVLLAALQLPKSHPLQLAGGGGGSGSFCSDRCSCSSPPCSVASSTERTAAKCLQQEQE